MGCGPMGGSSLDDWDMRSDRNAIQRKAFEVKNLDYWDMRSDRNISVSLVRLGISLDDWDMRSYRYLCEGGKSRPRKGRAQRWFVKIREGLNDLDPIPRTGTGLILKSMIA